MYITFLQLAKRILEEKNSPLSVDEIWQIAKANGYEKNLGSTGKTPWATLGSRLYVDTRDNENSLFATTGTRPKKFYLKSKGLKVSENDYEVLGNFENKKTTTLDFQERDLHAFAVYYGFYHLRAYFKTINHSKSSKAAFGEWLHPDIVGCYFPFVDWKDEVVKFSRTVGDSAIKLFSFELKKSLSFSNIRESFFQAVSNSSWAHEGYLVAAQIDHDEDFLSELERLSTSFGIGIIQIDVDDPDSTSILFSAKLKQIDWETVNKLASMNPDFSSFIKRVDIDAQTQNVTKELYDKIIERELLIKSVNRD